jgi:hypothetical protein
MVASALVPLNLSLLTDNGKDLNAAPNEQANTFTTTLSATQEVTSNTFTSRPNTFGLYCCYIHAPLLPIHDPENELTLDDLCKEFPQDSHLHLAESPTTSTSELASDFNNPLSAHHHSSFWPYPNRSSFLLGEWFWEGSRKKSKQEFLDLLNIICDGEFSLADVQSTRWDSINRALGDLNPSHSSWFITYPEIS